MPRAAGVNSGRLDMYYIAPDGKRMRSMSEVYQYLGLTAPAPKSSKPVISPQMLDAPRSSREAKIYATAAISGALSPTSHPPLTHLSPTAAVSGELSHQRSVLPFRVLQRGARAACTAAGPRCRCVSAVSATAVHRLW